MKTKSLILVTAMVLQMSIVLGSIAQNAVNVYPGNHDRKIKELIEKTPEFLKIDHASSKDDIDAMILQNWMLNPEEWTNDYSITTEATDPQIKLEDWMLDPLAMISTGSISNEELTDTTVELKDWMLNPNEMTSTQMDEKVQLEPWMLNPTKW